MKIKYSVVAIDGRVVEAQHFEDICCDDMKKALLNQETLLAKTNIKMSWLYCPFCKAEIEY